MRRRSILTIFQYQEVRNLINMIIFGILLYIVSRVIRNYFIASLIAMLIEMFIEMRVEKRFPIPDQSSKGKVNIEIRLVLLVLTTIVLIRVSWTFPIGSSKWWVMIVVVGLFLWLTIRNVKKWRGYLSETR